MTEPPMSQSDRTQCPGCGVSVPVGQTQGCLALGESPEPLLGRAVIARMGNDCCGKPQGCTNPTEGCIYKGHPFKRHLYVSEAPDA